MILGRVGAVVLMKPAGDVDPPQVASTGGESLVTKVTWFTLGSGRLDTSQSSALPLTSRISVEFRTLDPEEPPVSKNMFKEGSEKIV